MEKAVTSLLRGAAERGLDSLLIGGNAVFLLGFIRNTVDLDLLVPEEMRSRWLDLMRDLGYRFLHGVPAFAQFEPPDESAVPVDLMFVEQPTWEKLSEGAKEMDLAGERVLLPRPEYLVALKLHAAASPTRSKPEVDWEDIRQIVRLCALKPDEEPFRSLILVTVVKMRSGESNNFMPDRSAFAIDLNLPEFEEAQVEHWPSKMSWSDAMRIFAPARARYMREFDSPQQRVRDKNPEPFRLPPWDCGMRNPPNADCGMRKSE